MSPEELENLTVTKLVDARGRAYPGPLLEAKRSMSAVPTGGIMEVLSTDGGTNHDVPLWATKVGHEYLGAIEESDYWRIFVQRGR